MQDYQPINLEQIMLNLRYYTPTSRNQPKKYVPAKPDKYPRSGIWDDPTFKDQYIDAIKDSDTDILDSILKEASGVYRKEIIENMIKQREELKRKMLIELNSKKERIWEIKFNTLYGAPLPPNFRDLEKLYWMLDQLMVVEEIKCWKDVSFLQLKLLEENLNGGEMALKNDLHP